MWWLCFGVLLLQTPICSRSVSIGLIGNSNRINRGSFQYRILQLRGGADKKKKKAEESKKTMKDILAENEDEEDSDEEGDGLENAQPSTNSYLVGITDLWSKTPPITQIYIASSVLATVWAKAFNRNQWPNILNFDWKAILMGFQFWRLFTPFLFFGPLGLNYLLTIQFVWIYMAQLEKLNYDHPEEYLILLLFGAATLIGGYTLLGLSTRFLGHNLSTYLVYIWARIFEGTDVNVMDLFVLKAELLPWFFCAQTFVLEGELPFADFLGIVVGHLYHYLTQNKILRAPEALRNAFNTPSLKEKYSKFKGDFE